MSHDLKDTSKMLFADVENFGIRNSEDTNVDYIVVTHSRFKQPDGSIEKELAIGTTEADFKHGYVAVLDVLKFALQNCEDLVARALRETGMTNDIRRIADEVDQAFDMEKGQ